MITSVIWQEGTRRGISTSMLTGIMRYIKYNGRSVYIRLLLYFRYALFFLLLHYHKVSELWNRYPGCSKYLKSTSPAEPGTYRIEYYKNLCPSPWESYSDATQLFQIITFFGLQWPIIQNKLIYFLKHLNSWSDFCQLYYFHFEPL